jgi:hypothetical protein
MLLAGCGSVWADLIDATTTDPARSMTIWMSENGTASQGLAGVILIDLITATTTYHRDTLCVDLFKNIYLGQQYNTTVMTPNEATLLYGKQNLGLVSWLIDNALVPGQGSFTSVLPSVDWVTTPSQGAGIQLAIWDLVEDLGDGLTSGKVQLVPGATDPDVVKWAETYECLALGPQSPSCLLAGITPLGPGHPSNDAFVYINGNNNDVQMLEGPLFADGGPKPNPEPSTLALVGGGLLAASLAVRKKLRQRSRNAVPAL